MMKAYRFGPESALNTEIMRMTTAEACTANSDPPESTFAKRAASEFLSAASHDTFPYNARGSILIVLYEAG
jgi:hypothetical protein